MVRFKRLLTFLCAILLAVSVNLPVSAAKVNIDSWNTDSTLYEVQEKGAHTNSAVEFVFLRAKYDRPSNRIKLLFMLSLTSFTDESNAGVTMSVNGDEEITLHLNGNAEYNEDKYYAEINSVSDPRTMTLYLEVTLGIKKGIPDSVNLEFNVYDTEGVASNTYSADITEPVEDEVTGTTENEENEKEDKEEKTSKTKTTRTTKTKTTKAKTTRTKANKNDINSPEDIAEMEDESDSVATLRDETHTGQTEIEPVSDERKLTAGIVAATFAAVGIGTGGIYFFRKTKQRDGG